MENKQLLVMNLRF